MNHAQIKQCAKALGYEFDDESCQLLLAESPIGEAVWQESQTTSTLTSPAGISINRSTEEHATNGAKQNEQNEIISRPVRQPR